MGNEEEISDVETLVIFRSEANLKFAEQTENPHVIDNCTWEELEVYGRNWARWFKDDIVMLVGKE